MSRVTLTLRPDGPTRLDRLLVRHLADALPEPLSRKRVKALLDAGRVQLAGRVCRRANRHIGRVVSAEVRLDADDLRSTREMPAWELDERRIVHRDRWIVAVDKPAGLRSQASVAVRDDNLLDAVRRWRRRSGHDSDYVALHHRLDRATSGVVVLAIHRDANTGLAAAFRERIAKKHYRARTWPPNNASVPDTWTREGPCRRPGPEGDGDDGRWASTAFTVRERAPDGWLVDARPLTGRRHQIRIHLALEGMPIVGDARYGGAGAPGDAPDPGRHLLHHGRIELPHPVTGSALAIESSWPAAFRAGESE